MVYQTGPSILPKGHYCFGRDGGGGCMIHDTHTHTHACIWIYAYTIYNSYIYIYIHIYIYTHSLHAICKCMSTVFFSASWQASGGSNMTDKSGSLVGRSPGRFRTMGVPNSWMAYFMEDPNKNWMIGGGTPMDWKHPFMEKNKELLLGSGL